MDFRTVSVLMVCLAFIASSAACASLAPPNVASAAKKRDVICDFVEVWAKDQPQLAEVKRLCDADAELREIAAAYAGCQAD